MNILWQQPITERDYDNPFLEQVSDLMIGHFRRRSDTEPAAVIQPAYNVRSNQFLANLSRATMICLQGHWEGLILTNLGG